MHDLGPPSLEGGSRHHAVLKAEQSDERDVDHDGDAERRLRTFVHGQAGEGEVADEYDQVEKGREKDRVTENRKNKRSNA
jgi:hypothetical protein